MQQFFLALLLFSFVQVHGQQQNKASTLSNQKPDTAFTGQIIKDKTKHTKIYLTGFEQAVDSIGIYNTTYIFGSKMSKPTFDVDIEMNFDTPLVPDGPIGFQYGPYGVGRYSGSGAIRNNNTFLFLKGQFISPGHHFYIKVKSKQKPQPVINGIDGQGSF